MKPFFLRLRESIKLAIAHMTEVETVEEKVEMKSKYIGDTPRTELLAGDFEYEYPYKINGSIFFPTNNLLRAVNRKFKATSEEEIKEAEEIIKQVSERDNGIFVENLESCGRYFINQK